MASVSSPLPVPPAPVLAVQAGTLDLVLGSCWAGHRLLLIIGGQCAGLAAACVGEARTWSQLLGVIW